MKRFALAAAAVLLLAPQMFAAGTWNKSIVAAQKQAKASKQLIFVDLFADWCGWCHRMEQEVFPSQVFQQQTDKMVLLRLNTEDNGEGQKLSQQFLVTSLPTFLVLTPDLELAGMIRGYSPSKEFADKVKTVENEYIAFQKLVASEPTFAGDYQKRYDLAREFTQRYSFPDAESRFKKLVGEKKTPVEIRDQSYYELAIAQVMQSHLDEANKTLGAFTKVQSKGDPFERSRILQAQIYLQQGNVAGATNELKAFRTKYPNSPLRVNAEVMLAQLDKTGTSK